MFNKLILVLFFLCLLISPTTFFGQSSQNKISSFLLGGDFCFAETYQTRLEDKGEINILKTYGYDYSLQAIAPLLARTDLSIVNLETPLTDLSDPPFSENEKYKIHKGDIIQNPLILNKYKISVVSLANNHTMDFGHEGLLQTFQVLTDHGIHFFGAGKNEKEASEPYQFNFQFGNKILPIVVIAGLDFSKKYDEQYQFYADSNAAGVNAFTQNSVIAQISENRKVHPEAFIIVFPHWFVNYDWITPEQTELVHAMIDAGADIVIGHGTHMFQEIERYKNKWIIYSLGNLMFNSPGRYQKKEANPYSCAALVESECSHKCVAMQMKLYFILSDNRKTNYQPRFLKKREMKEALALLKGHTLNSKYGEDYEKGRDKIGYFITLNLK